MIKNLKALCILAFFMTASDMTASEISDQSKIKRNKTLANEDPILNFVMTEVTQPLKASLYKPFAFVQASNYCLS